MLKNLYAHRKVLNGKEILIWAKKQGFDHTLPEKELHITCIYSSAKVDWSEIKADDSHIKIIGGKREIEVFGDDKNIVVLRVQSNVLQTRFDYFKKHGCSYDFPSYKPHVTITYKKDPKMNIKDIIPYHGDILLGEEIFAEINEDYSPNEKKT